MEHFIETVKKYPCLWNATAIEYRDQELKDAAWSEIMRETNMTSVKEVKMKWKKLRDSYRDALKRQSEMLAKEPHNPLRRNYPWKYMADMRFLQPHMGNRRKAAESPPHAAPAPPAPHAPPATHAPHAPSSEPAQNGTERSSDDSESDAESSPKRKSCSQLTVIDRKLDYLCKAQSKRQQSLRRGEGGAPPPPPSLPDPLDIFFNSMCQSTKRLPYPTQIKIKKVLFNAVVDAEEALLAEQASYAAGGVWAAPSSSSEPEREDEDRKPA